VPARPGRVAALPRAILRSSRRRARGSSPSTARASSPERASPERTSSRR
jgi:hypothetical protein